MTQVQSVGSSNYTNAVNSRALANGGGGNSYNVVRGDCLWKIARAHGVSLSSLIAANPQIKNPDLIYPGQKIRIPKI